ncbi:MAG TPA: hypothetical protein VJ723_01040 [Candidatus Angelobacter sp.]|nr:hypothetical protein [Candidatus Angelobacter sp.]
MSYITIDDKDYTKEEYEAHRKQIEDRWLAEYRAKKEKEGKAKADAANLVRQMGEAYRAYTGLLRENPKLCLNPEDDEAIDREILEKLRANLEQAAEAPRCGYIKVNGMPCGSPRMKDEELCYAHKRMASLRPATMDLPPLEDANSIQLGLMEVARGLMDGTMDSKKAGLMLYCLQIASANVVRTTFDMKEAVGGIRRDLRRAG